MAGDISFISQLPIWFMQFSAIDINEFFGRIGAFELILPFLLIFSLVFGILTSTNILGSNKPVNILIAVTIALMSLQVGLVQSFFIVLFPRLAIGLAIILGVVILSGLFIPSGTPGKGWFIGFGVGGIVIAIGAVLATFDTLNWFDTYFWHNAWPAIIGGILVLILVIFVAVAAKPKDSVSDGGFVFKPFRE